jgi:uncharacterized membrane protein
VAIPSLFKRKTPQFFSEQEKEVIVSAIKQAERQTSGEVRVFVESHCRFVDPLDRAAEIFATLKMSQTAQRNACLVYVAMKDRQLAVFGDEGIHQKVGTSFWTAEVAKMLGQFNRENYATGIAMVVEDIGGALRYYFPYNADTDKNELPDEIVFGD